MKKINNIIFGAIVGYIGIYVLAFFCLLLTSFFVWENYMVHFSLNDLFLVRMGLFTGIIGAIIGGFYPE